MSPDASPPSAIHPPRLEAARAAWGDLPAVRDYWEDFTQPERGWIANSRSPLPIGSEGALCKGPWILDANHAPPGAGYLHLLMHLHTLEERLHAPYARECGMYSDAFIAEKRHRFIHGGYSRNLTNARIRVCLRGDVELRGSQMTILVQGQRDPKDSTSLRGNWVLTGQHFTLTREWSHQEVVLTPDESQWTFLGSRHDLTDLYGYVPIAQVLADVNVSFIFILYPLTVEAEEPVADLHRAWADRDYTARRDRLPTGQVEFRSVWFRYPDQP